MAYRRTRRSIWSGRKRQSVSGNGAHFFTPLLLFCLLAVALWYEASGHPRNLIRQPAPQPVGTSNKTGDDQGVRELVPGAPIKRELASEQAHTYRIRVNARGCLKRSVESKRSS